MSGASRDEEPGRRSLLATLAAFAALIAIVIGISLAAGVLRRTDRPSSPSIAAHDPQVAAFLGPLAQGTPFGRWRISRVDPPARGRITLELAGEGGERFVVDVHARSPLAPAGIAETSRLAIYVRAGKSGALTPDAAQRACAALAEALSEREEAGHEPPRLEALAPRQPLPI